MAYPPDPTETRGVIPPVFAKGGPLSYKYKKLELLERIAVALETIAKRTEK